MRCSAQALLVFVMLGGLLSCAEDDQAKLAQESALKNQLRVMRDMLDQYYGDNGSYPENLELLVEEGYLRVVPTDPITGRTDTWVEVRWDDEEQLSGVVDITSGAEGVGLDGTLYSTW